MGSINELIGPSSVSRFAVSWYHGDIRRLEIQCSHDARAASAGVGTVNEDWTFSIRVILGPAPLFATVPDGWMVKAIRRNNREISEMPLELKSEEQLSHVLESLITATTTTKIVT